MVSVIIPNYNHASFLKKRIDSIINQTYQNYELIILDDCSSDDSEMIISQYKNHPKVSHIIFNEYNSGSPFYQWQKAFSLIKGDLIWIAESDDYAENNFLEKLVPCFDTDSKIGLVYCDSNVIDADGELQHEYCKKLKNSQFCTDKWNYNYKKQGSEEIAENLIFECTINNMSATLFKKQFLHNINFERLLQFKYSGDWYFLIGLVKDCNLYYVPDPLNYFKHGTNNFKSGAKTSLTYFKELCLVKYFYWSDISGILNAEKRKKVYTQMGNHMRLVLNETIKGNIQVDDLYKTLKLLFDLSPSLFKKQTRYCLSGYLNKVTRAKDVFNGRSLLC